MGDLFEKIKVKKINYKAGDLLNYPKGDFLLPALTAGIQNQGLNNYVPYENVTVLKNKITISANGANTGATFYQNKDFTVLQDAYAINWIYTSNELSEYINIFLVSSISNKIYGKFEWTNKAGWEKVKNETIQLPIKNGVIDFDFMECFVVNLEQDRMQTLQAYLQVTGLDNYELTNAEQKALDNYKDLEFAEFNLEKLFGKAKRGKRLKSDDRILGDLPFITAGEANEGFSAYVGNNIDVFSNNTVTIDMFGSAKYRNYNYGADDHVAVVNTTAINKFASIFVTSAIHKTSYNGQFNYGRNFYAKDADIMNISLPIKDNQPDYAVMETLVSAIQKLVIKDVVLYTTGKLIKT